MRLQPQLRLLAMALVVMHGMLSACGAPALQPLEPTVPATPASIVDPSSGQSTAVSPTLADPLVPTVLPGLGATALPTVTLQPDSPGQDADRSLSDRTSSAAPVEPVPDAAVPEQAGVSGAMRRRLGVGVPLGVTSFTFDQALADRLGLGWYLDWHVQADPVQAGGLEFAQMIRVRGDRYLPNRSEIAKALAANPGSLWLIGNEPDVMWQDNTSPEEYARRYHELYVFIKSLDPSAQVAIGGISQVTPLRLSYLERVLAAYEALYGDAMPVDVWNIHTFILREERDSWGVSIPPGFEDIRQGMLWEIEDHDDLELLEQQIVDFRRWMLARGQRDKPLIVTEFGILMPGEYGFSTERVTEYMRRSFDLLLNARNPEIGYPADDNRMVQRLLWYSLSDTTYPIGNLVDPVTGELTLLGQAFAAYAQGLDAAP